MKKLIILMILLGGCVSVPQSPVPSINPSTYSPPSYVTTTENYHAPVKPVPLHHSLSNLSAHIAYDTLKFPVISDYLEQNPKAWIDIKYNRMTIYSLQKAICYSKVPVKIYDKDDVLVDNDFRKDPKSYQCNLPFIGLRPLIEVELINHGMKRVVLGGDIERKIWSDERHFQMKHASTRTLHPPGHTAGASLLMILTVDEPHHPQIYRYVSSDGTHRSPIIDEGLDPLEYQTVIHVEVVRVRNNEVMFSKNYLLEAGPYRTVYVNDPPNN